MTDKQPEQHLTVSQLATMLQRSRNSNTTLIEQGLLKAYDAAPDGRYRQWRVTPEFLSEYQERHSSVQPVKQSRKRTPAAAVNDYIG